MTDQELRKLKRSELLEMMIEQGKTVMELREELSQASQRQAETDAEVKSLKETIERLKTKLNAKDDEIDQQAVQLDETYRRLSKKLNAKDAEIDKQARQLAETYKRLAHKLDVKDNKIRELKSVILKGHGSEDTVVLIGDEFDQLPEDMLRPAEPTGPETQPEKIVQPEENVHSEESVPPEEIVQPEDNAGIEARSESKGTIKLKAAEKKPVKVKIERVKAGG